MNVIERIQEKYGEMTKKQRVLADYMLENPDSMSFMTMKNLSSRTQVSEMTILHYCGALGYGNYNELKYEFRKYINERNKIEVQRENAYLNSRDVYKRQPQSGCPPRPQWIPPQCR